MSSGVPSADPSITVFGMRPLLKPTLTVGAAALLVITSCTDDAGNAQDTAPSTAQPAPAESTEPTRESDGVLTIGVLLPQTGEGSSIGNPGIAAATQAVNEINTRLGFCRCFWVNGQVLIEAEHLGLTIKTQDFSELADNVASASDYFGPKLVERFGGKLAFEDSKGEQYDQPPFPGMYL